jgi:hypothetical protein
MTKGREDMGKDPIKPLEDTGIPAVNSWGALWHLDDGRWIHLFTPEEISELPDGTVVVCISGGTKIIGRDYIDLDTRSGYTAYGALCTPDHNHLRGRVS